MSWRRLFYSDSGALRAPWRLLIFAVATICGLVVAQGIAGPIIAQLFELVGIRGVSNEWLVETLGVFIGTVVALRYIDKRPWRDVWLDRSAARPQLLAFGFAVGALAIGVPIALLIGVHWLRQDTGAAGSWWGAAFRVTLTLLPAALFEELMTRGYALSVLREWLGWKWAIVITSVGFGLLHLANNGATAESVALVTLAGFFLAGVLYSTRSLYAAWMAHFAWNWTMAVLFHSAVSGYPMESPRYRYVDAGPDWATGGDWGPEGGIPAGLGMVGGMVFLFARGRRRASDATERR
ncbi:MAG: Abortive infection protein [Gemmatimonadetes bacterium]|nr:Abortive infection protein [Gemmatimonadota bacterium]